MSHRKAVTGKPLSSKMKTELESIMDKIVQTVDYVKCGVKRQYTCVFQKLCKEMDADNVTVLLPWKCIGYLEVKCRFVCSKEDGKF